MAIDLPFTCSLRLGLHARPAAAMEKVARCFKSEVHLLNLRTGAAANAKSMLAIMAVEVQAGDACRLSVAGSDAEAAVAALAELIRDALPHCDEAETASPASVGDPGWPRGLRSSGATLLRGTIIAGGVGVGRIRRAGALRVSPSLALVGEVNVSDELLRLENALGALTARYEDHVAGAKSALERELLEAHRAVARDPELHAQLYAALRQGGRTLAGAVSEAEAHFRRLFVASGSGLLKERVLDLHDVCMQVVREAYGADGVTQDGELAGDAVVVAEALTPGQLLALERRAIRGLVLGNVGATSHTAILARAFGIPTLTGLTQAWDSRWAAEGEEAVVDGEVGALVTGLTPAARRYYQRETRRVAEAAARQSRATIGPMATADGHRLEMGANIAAPEEVEGALRVGAEGIGLFRTEMLFLGRSEPPDEEEQLTAYSQTLASAAGRPVIIRTLDVGGDKPVDYLSLPAEDNPLLGFRSARIYPAFEAIFRTQVRALVRASAHGPLKVMVPMIANVAEAQWVKRVVAEEQARCGQEGLAFDAGMALGAMIEVPSAVFLLDHLARELQFFSVGSNDLAQYFSAADRTNSSLAPLCDPLQPAFLRLLQKIVLDCHREQRWVGLCGEMGGQVEFLPLVVGLGFDEISATPSAISALRGELRRWTYPRCQELVAEALQCSAPDEVRQLLERASVGSGAPLLDADLVMLDSDSQSKEEALQEVADRLFVAGRTSHPRRVEEAIWQRETSGATGIGHGFALPHCRSSAVKATSLAVVRLQNPVPWGGPGEPLVSTLVLLATRESDAPAEHLKAMAKLARRLAHEEYRASLTGAGTVAEVNRLLENALTAS